MTEPPTSPGAESPTSPGAESPTSTGTESPTSTGAEPATSPEAEPATSPGAEPARSFAAEPPTSFAAIRFTAADEVLLDPAKPLPPLGPHSILLRIEACGICFSDTKLLHAFAKHPRKSDVLAVLADAVGFAAGGFDPERPQSELLAQLAATAGYAPGAATVTPGHETVARIVAVGEAVRRHRVGERVSVQTDFRHLPTAASNAAFGYTMDGGLEEYTVVDERVVTEPGTGKRFLIPVSEGPTASQVALVEPWSCVETAYAWPERQGPEPGGRVLVVTDPGRVVEGLDELLAAVPAEVVSWPRQSGPGEETFPAGGFSDIVYFGADAATAEALGPLLAPRGLIALVTGGARFDRPVQVDAGRIHYDLIRYCGTTSTSAADAYARIPATCDLRPGDRLAIIGAAGPMGLMHTMRAACSGVPGLAIDAVDVDDARLAHLAATVGPFASARGVPASFRNSKTEPLDPGYGYIATMVPAPALLSQAVDLAADGAIVNAFAGFAVGTLAPIDLNAVAERGVYLVGTSGSTIRDMTTMLAQVEAGTLDTNVSLDAVTGLAGVVDALAAVDARTSGGKIMVYPALVGLPLIRLADLPDKLPHVAAFLDSGRWTKAAEEALLATGGALLATEEALLTTEEALPATGEAWLATGEGE